MLTRLAHYILPEEIEASFELTDVKEEGKELHLYLEERAVILSGYESSDLQANGFYELSCIQDFPVRDREVKLYVKRRQWKEKKTGKSVSKDLEPVTRGICHSKEFAALLKGMHGEIPDHGPLA